MTIRDLYESGLTYAEVAEAHGLRPETVRRALLKGGVKMRPAKRRTIDLQKKLTDSSIPEPNSGCVLWMLSTAQFGYGIIVHKYKRLMAHRVSWEVNRGPIPTGLRVLHKCDVPACINPDHLFLGTDADNRADKKNKKRHSFGEAHGCAKLTENAVREIRTASGSSAAVGAKFGVSSSQVRRIRLGEAWAHLLKEGARGTVETPT